MEIKFGVYALAALIPVVLRLIWYNPKVFGTAWMEATGLTKADTKKGNMAVMLIVSYVFSLLLAFFMQFLVIHQAHLISILMEEPGFGEAGSTVQNLYESLMANYGKNFRTFGHGAFHGVIDAIFFVLPILGTNALFEQKGFKYIAVNVGYWIVCLALIGGVVCQFA
ncbi:MAG: hypothetical protein ACI8ZO_001540 [Flavobacteriales bacterium]|jgi:hypothetical protein